MGTLIHNISATTDAEYGVNILEVQPPSAFQGVSTNTVGFVGDYPWGPVDTITTITSPAEFFATFGPSQFGRLDTTFPALLAFLSKTFPGPVEVVRISATGQATAAQTFDDTGATASVDVTARFPGAQGNNITIAWTANADDAANRDATVAIGSTYSVLHKNVATPDGGLTVVDPGDPFVIFTPNVSGVNVPVAAAAAPLVTGADGTAVLGDYIGATTEGLKQFLDASARANVLFGAEIPSTLVDGWNSGLKAQLESTEDGTAVYSANVGLSRDDAITAVGTLRFDRFMFPFPRALIVNTFDPDRGTVEVDPNSFYAVAIAGTPPEKSPGGKPGSQFLRGIVEIVGDPISNDDYKLLNDSGIAPLFNSSGLQGHIIRRGVTTSLIGGETRMFRRTMTDFIGQSLAIIAEQFVEEPLDIDLANKALGPITSVEFGQWQTFLADLQNPTGVGGQRIREFSIDAFGANLQSNIDNGQWIVAVSVKLLSAQEEIILQLTSGEFVTITEL